MLKALKLCFSHGIYNAISFETLLFGSHLSNKTAELILLGENPASHDLGETYTTTNPYFENGRSLKPSAPEITLLRIIS